MPSLGKRLLGVKVSSYPHVESWREGKSWLDAVTFLPIQARKTASRKGWCYTKPTLISGIQTLWMGLRWDEVIAIWWTARRCFHRAVFLTSTSEEPSGELQDLTHVFVLRGIASKPRLGRRTIICLIFPTNSPSAARNIRVFWGVLPRKKRVSVKSFWVAKDWNCVL